MPNDEPIPTVPSPIEIPKSAEANPHLDELEAELSTLANLQSLWQPCSVPDQDDSAPDIADPALKALDRVIKLSHRRTKLLGLENRKISKGSYKHLTLKEFDERFKRLDLSEEP